MSRFPQSLLQITHVLVTSFVIRFKPIVSRFCWSIYGNFVRVNYLILFILALALPVQTLAQELNKPKPVQLSGITVTEDQSILPFVTILVKNRFKGTVSDQRGFFSFVALKGDTIQFSEVGFKPNYFIMPETQADLYTLVMPLERDTIVLPMANIYPWPSKEAFRDAFLNAQVEDDLYDKARKNLEAQMLAEISAKMGMDGSENQKLYMQRMIAQTYYAGGQQPFAQFGGPNSLPIPSTLLNPFAWAEFVKALKRGDFKKK